jgi:hypothetical protein
MTHHICSRVDIILVPGNDLISVLEVSKEADTPSMALMAMAVALARAWDEGRRPIRRTFSAAYRIFVSIQMWLVGGLR